jgi:hypothetical protein
MWIRRYIALIAELCKYWLNFCVLVLLQDLPKAYVSISLVTPPPPHVQQQQQQQLLSQRFAFSVSH